MKKQCLIPVVAAMSGLLAGCATSQKQDGITVSRPSTMLLPFREPPGGWNFKVGRGDTRETVVALCDQPDFAIGDNTWIYWHTDLSEPAARNAGYNTLVMFFVDGQLDDMRLVSGDVVRSRIAAMVARGQQKK